MAKYLKWKLIMIGFLRIKRWISSFSKFWTSVTSRLLISQNVFLADLSSLDAIAIKGVCVWLTYWGFVSDVLEEYVECLEELHTNVTSALLVHYLQEKRKHISFQEKAEMRIKRNVINRIHHNLERIVWVRQYESVEEVDNEQKGFPIGPDHVIMHRNGVGLILPFCFF